MNTLSNGEKLFLIKMDAFFCQECLFTDKNENCYLKEKLNIKECPLIPFKAKDLIWKEKYKGYISTINTNGLDYVIKIYDTFSNAEYAGMTIHTFCDCTIEYIKEYCQKHYNMLFFKMLDKTKIVFSECCKDCNNKGSYECLMGSCAEKIACDHDDYVQYMKDHPEEFFDKQTESTMF